MIVKFENGNIILQKTENFILSQTLDCGQAFRWKEDENGIWSAIVNGKLRRLSQNGSTVIIYNADKEEYDTFYRHYFDLERDYKKIVSDLSENPILKDATAVAGGIRILRQDPWETVCSFIISQNNNIPRIKGIISRLCENFGQKTDGGYTFPSYKTIACLSVEDLAPIRSGFRAKYIIDAAKKFADGTVSNDIIAPLSTDEAREILTKIYGVGNKVADCVLLFAFGKMDAFPKDVWIKRAMEKLFDGKLPECTNGVEGIAQQYIFHYARLTKLDI